MTTAFPRVPFDVQLLIIDWAYRLSQAHNIDHKTLATCSLVCNAWTLSAQRLLFRRFSRFTKPGVDLSPSQLIPIFRGNPLLGGYVRSFVALWSDGEDILTLLSLCPNVVKLRLIDGWSSLAGTPQAVARLRALNLRLTVLDLDRVCFDAHDTYLQAFLSMWPTLRFLRIGHHPLGGPSHIVHGPVADLPSTPPHFLCDIQLDLPQDLPRLAWIFSFGSAHTSLRAVELDDEHLGRGQAQIIANGVGAHIRSFSRFSYPSQRMLDCFTQLEELVFQVLPDSPSTLPQSVRHVGYHPVPPPWWKEGMEFPPEPDAHVAHLITTLAVLPRLRLVTTTRRSRQATVLEPLEAMCRSLGVEFIIYPDAESFPRPRYVDWI